MTSSKMSVEALSRKKMREQLSWVINYYYNSQKFAFFQLGYCAYKLRYAQICVYYVFIWGSLYPNFKKVIFNYIHC